MPTIFELEYWAARDTGASHLEATHRAIDYIRRFTNREVAFFSEEDYKRSPFDDVDYQSELQDMLTLVLEKLNKKELRLFITLVKLFEVDATVEPSFFQKYAAYDEIQITEICPKCKGKGQDNCNLCDGTGFLPDRGFTHKRAAKLAGFPTKDNALKSYHKSLTKIRRLLDELGYNPLTPKQQREPFKAREASTIGKPTRSRKLYTHAGVSIEKHPKFLDDIDANRITSRFDD